MTLEGAAVSAAATGVSALFAALVFRQWLGHRRPYQFAWSVGLGLYAIAAFTQFLGEEYGWSVPVYKVYYLIAALLVAVLGIGSTLLVHRRAGIGFALYTAIVFVGFAIAVAGTAVDPAAFALPFPVAGTAIPDGNVRAFSYLFTIPGSVALIGVAIYSYWRTRLRFNLWIGIGALIVAAGGSLARLSFSWALYIGELLGIAVMFWGFLASQDVVKARAPAPAQIPS
ncbi:MAG: hypothetical protein E6K14_07405 [Methanobacteriota archaeon]|nr:MAG: hypothetical protein E6K14_07405 [Euryarchaeota archaeon]